MSIASKLPADRLFQAEATALSEHPFREKEADGLTRTFMAVPLYENSCSVYCSTGVGGTSIGTIGCGCGCGFTSGTTVTIGKVLSLIGFLRSFSGNTFGGTGLSSFGAGSPFRALICSHAFFTIAEYSSLHFLRNSSNLRVSSLSNVEYSFCSLALYSSNDSCADAVAMPAKHSAMVKRFLFISEWF